MSSNIKYIDDRNFKVNGLLVFKDTNDKWIGTNLTKQFDIDAANNYIASLDHE